VSVNNNFVTTLKENLKHPVRLAVKTLLNGWCWCWFIVREKHCWTAGWFW
jgi:hypothetical protein